MGPFTQPQWPSWAYSGLEDQFSAYTQLPNYPGYLADSMETYQTHHNRHLVHHHHMSRATESKPRLSKEEVEVLEAEFQKNHKPSSSTKKALAESMRVDNARINNWFQNRRAREKKENNIREYEAKQRLEKEKAAAESGHQPENSRQRDLVASSAPFPEFPATSRTHGDDSRSPSPQSLPDAASDLTAPSQVGDSGSPSLSSPQSRPATPPSAHPSALDNLESDDKSMLDSYSGPVDGFFNAPEACSNDLAHGLPLDEPQLLTIETKSSGQVFGDYQSFMASEARHDDAQGSDHCFTPAGDLSPVTDDSQQSSPHASDVASRRNRRPAPLAIGEGRSYSSYTPRTSVDFDRRGDRASPLRRVASATGTSRIRKVAATPRSPFYDGPVDMAAQMRRSPSLICTTGSRAPPTPDTPVALHQQGLMGGALSYSLDGKFMNADMSLQDPTLRTPPTTPGFMESLFNMGTGFDMSISEEALISPEIGRLSGGFNVASAMSGFGAGHNGCTSEPSSALLPSQMGPAYFGNFLGDGVTGYGWSDVATPTTASPGLRHRQSGYSISSPELEGVVN